MRKKEKEINCILSGRIIPQGKYSIEHYMPRALVPPYIADLPQNKFPAIKIFNQVKAAHYPCQWYAMRYELCYHAYQNWNIKPSDKHLLGEAVLNGMPEYDPCKYCVAKKFVEYCIHNRKDGAELFKVR